MHITYLGIMSRPEDLGKIGISSVAGNKMQYNLLHYLSEYEDVSIDIISFHPFKSFPSGKLFVKSRVEYLFDGKVKLYQIGYLNISVIKQCLYPLITYIKARNLTKEADVVFAYDMYPTQGLPLSWLKKRVKGKTICLLADLSLGGVHKETGLRKYLRKLFDWSTLKSIKKCDHFIVLNENAAKVYAPHSKYLVMDGGIEPSEFAHEIVGWNGRVKNIVYTGALVEYSGIMNLIKAMSLIKSKDVVLDIYGLGHLKDKVEEIAKNSSNIRFHGFVSNQEAMNVQQTSWLLANPRPVDNSIAQVTFPSKIFEYMMSGRPVMSTRLNGFSKDYDNLLFWVEDGTPETLAQKIDEINECSSDRLQAVADNAREYLLQNKTWKINAEKVHEFIGEMVDKIN